MSMPELILTENLAPLVPTRAHVHEIACESAEAAYRNGTEPVPTWFIATGTRVVALATAWENTLEKRASQQLVRVLLHAIGAQAYAFLSETWTAVVTKKSDAAEDVAAFEAKMAWIDRHGVAELPPHERESVLLVSSAGRKEGDSGMSRYVINSGGKTPWLGIRVDETEAQGLTGPMFNLFSGPVPDPRLADIARQFLAGMEAKAKMAM